MIEVYSKRTNPPPDVYQYDIPRTARVRVFAAVQRLSSRFMGSNGLSDHGVVGIFRQPRPLLMEMSGPLAGGGFYHSDFPSDVALDDEAGPVLTHIFGCSDERFLDFLEIAVRVLGRHCGAVGVTQINSILSQEGIGYELTQPIVVDHSGQWDVREHSVVIKKTSQMMHATVVRPALGLLSDPRFKVANAEMRKAMNDHRHGRLDDAITSAGAAFESALKTICGAKGWPYDPDKDTVSKLVSICRDNNLFPPFYAPLFEATGTVRNKLGDAHGRGPSPLYRVEEGHVDHVIQMVSANILLLMSLAKL